MRYEDWPSKLHSYIESMQNAKFSYGEFDCGLFAAGCIEAMTGLDLAEDLRGYTNRRGAMEACKRLCCSASIRKLGDHIASKYNLKSVPVLMAQRGDLALVGDRRFGIVALNGTEITVPAKTGVMRVPLKDASQVYRV